MVPAIAEAEAKAEEARQLKKEVEEAAAQEEAEKQAQAGREITFGGVLEHRRRELQEEIERKAKINRSTARRLKREQ